MLLKSSFDRSDRNPKDLGRFPVFQTLVINQLYGGAELLRQSVERLANPLSPLVSVAQLSFRIQFLTDQQIN